MTTQLLIDRPKLYLTQAASLAEPCEHFDEVRLECHDCGVHVFAPRSTHRDGPGALISCDNCGSGDVGALAA